MLQLPEVHRKEIRGPSKRYVLVMESPFSDDAINTPPFLLNPLTRTHISLPFSALVYCPLYLGPKSNPNPSPTGMVNENDVLAVVLLVGSYDNLTRDSLAFWHSSDEKWSSVEVPKDMAFGYYKSSFFSVCNNTKETMVVDVTTGGILFRIPPPQHHKGITYLIEAFGDLLGVVEPSRCNSNMPLEDYGFEEHDGGKPRWIKLSSIGDRVLFLDPFQGLCLNATDFDGFKGNCIYFQRMVLNNRRFTGILSRYDLDEGRSQMLDPNVAYDGTWFVPCLY
ncbi:hypothetical protein LUZ60_016421 [Juncus effusus]|nr:hypothetical protein LUZ60_016421 [Juncus effusus]